MEQKPRGAMLSRRGFLKAAAATGAAGSAGASLTGIAASAAQAEPAASETLGFTYHNEHCLCNCMLQCTVRDGRLAMIQPRENEDKRFQNVCLKGISEVQNIYGDARIQRPMKRVGERGSGEFEAISWDEAFQMIAENFKAIQDKYGKEALWIQFSTEASQRFPPLLASVLGAQAGGLNGYDMGQGNGQIMAFSPWIGMFAQNTMWEWPEANVVILANTNLVETSLTWSRGMLDAQEAGTKFICLDPRFSPTAGKADQWVNLRAGTDPAFFLGMTKYILDEELFDREHVLAHTALPFLIDAETGACLADVVTGTDPETGEPVGEGEMGELVLTPLCKQGIPVLRYRTHDLTAVHTEPCACGRTLARMDKVRSRSDDMLIIRGTNVFPSQIEDVLTGIEEVTPHYHIIVETRGGMDALIVETELRPEAFRDSFEAMDALRARIAEKLKGTLLVAPEVRLVEPGGIERAIGKAKHVDDRREK